MMLKEKANVYIEQGTSIIGKWNKRQYFVVKKLGSGMVGTVYLCRENGKFVALKISEQAMSMTTEVNVLKSLGKHQTSLGPRLLDVDDWKVAGGETRAFYVMEYIRGENINAFIKRNGPEWVGILLLQLLDQLARLHDTGWVFGDLKNDNLLVEKNSSMIRLIDVGGTTKAGRSIKEYTEFHDRAYWGLGGRKAEASYDLFALVMVVLKIYYPNGFKRQGDSGKMLQRKVTDVTALNLYAYSLHRALQGEYETANKMKNDIMKMLVTLKIKEVKRKRNVSARLFESFLIFTVTGIYGVAIYFLF